MSNQTHTTDDAILEQIMQRSATDREFRTRLIEQPSSAIEEIIGVPMSSLPKPINVRFVEKEAGLDALVVLPEFLDYEGSLSDAELEAVAGGDWCITSCTLTITICTQTEGNGGSSAGVVVCKAE